MFKQRKYNYNNETGTLTIDGKCGIIERGNIMKAVCGSNPNAPYYTTLKHVVFENQDFISIIGKEAFHNCRGIQKIDIPRKVTRIERDAFNNCQGLTFPIKFPPELEYLGECAFIGCKELTGSIVLPKSLSDTIGERTFGRCEKLSGTLEIPQNIRYIYDAAFSGCSGIEKLILNENIIRITEAAFMCCTGLREIHCKSKLPPKLGENVFYKVDKKSCKLIIPNGVDVLLAYKKAEQWKDFFIIEQC